MTPQELKNSILQLAIQGKLVEQRSEEGTAEELYRQIQREKQALIKAGKIKKEKPLPEITEDEIPFDIPESWKWVRIGDIASVLGGKRIPAGRQLTKENTGHIYIRISDMKNDGIETDRLLFVPQDIYPTISKYIINKEDVYITVAGTIGRIGKIPSELDGANLTENADRLVFQHLDQDWLIQCLKSNLVQSQIADATTKVGQPKLAIKRIENMIIALPSLSEQRRIVAKIEELLPLIDRYEKAWTRLEDFNKRFPADMQKSILQLAIQGKLTEQRLEEGTGEELYRQIQKEKQSLIKAGKIKKEKPLSEITYDEIPFDIPESWKWVRLVELGVFSSGKTPTMGESKYWKNGTVQWFTSKDMKKKYLDKSEMQITELAASEMIKYPAGTLLMVVRSGILKRMLPLCILTQDSTINQDIKAYRLFDSSISEYVYFMIKGLETYILENYRKQVTTVDSLKFDEFSKEMLVPLPPLAEQKRIVAKLEELLPLCERLK